MRKLIRCCQLSQWRIQNTIGTQLSQECRNKSTNRCKTGIFTQGWSEERNQFSLQQKELAYLWINHCTFYQLSIIYSFVKQLKLPPKNRITKKNVPDNVAFALKILSLLFFFFFYSTFATFYKDVFKHQCFFCFVLFCLFFYTAGSYQSSILYKSVYTCQSQSPNSAHHHPHPTAVFPPLVSICLFSTSVSQLLPCKPAHLYHFSRFHIHALIYDICFSLSDLLHSV